MWFSWFTHCFKVVLRKPKNTPLILEEQVDVVLPDLPDDLFRELFIRLPGISIGRCMCVCKRWHSLLKNPSFVSLYSSTDNKRSYRNHYLVLWNNEHQLHLHFNNRSLDYYKLYAVPEPYQYPAENCISICNGVICLAKDPFTLLLWNPAIQKMLTLPQSNVMPNRPSDYNQHHGIAFDSLANDYKVFRILVYGNGIDSHIEVFSLNRNSWKFGCQIDKKYHFWDRVPITLNGAIHWIAHERSTRNKFDETSVILGFDVNAEIFRHINLPKNLEVTDRRWGKRLVAYKDSSLAVVTMTLTGSNIKLWVMKEYGNMRSWAQIWQFDDICRGLSLMNCMRHLVEVRQDSRKWLLELLPLWNEEVISHIAAEQDLETAYLKKLVISHIYKPFQESLVLIDNDNAEQVRCVPCVEEKKERNFLFLRRKARNKEILNDLCVLF